jgi:nucleotide-binding universal stress UspA family protein
MNNHLESNTIRRVMVGTDRSETADRAVRWAAEFAGRYGAELFVVQVEVPHHPATTEFGAAERTRAAAANDELAGYVRQVAGERAHALVVIDRDPASAIIRAAEQEAVDVLVVGNAGMAGRKEFCLATYRTASVTCPLHRDYREHLASPVSLASDSATDLGEIRL